ncbi:MAG: AcvB/VirJ family lysyl-phosphatidylglycerol hydrolase [Novosphingobium sp.]
MTGAIIGERRSAKRKSGQRWKAIALAAVGLLLVVITTAPRLGLLGWQERLAYAPEGQAKEDEVVFLSGDMGLHLGLSGNIARGLAAHGYRVIGVSSPVVFASRQTPEQARQIVTDAISTAMNGHARKVILAGQSFGADVIASILPRLPAQVRQNIAGTILVVPSDNVHLRADPSGLAYLGEPDLRPAAALNRLTDTPLTCIQGKEEASSLCPMLQGRAQRRIVLPGDHYLDHDAAKVIATMTAAIAAMAHAPNSMDASAQPNSRS